MISGNSDLVPGGEITDDELAKQWGNVRFDPLTMEITYPSGRKAFFAGYAEKKHPVGVPSPADATPRDRMRYQHVWKPTTIRNATSILRDGNDPKRRVRDLAFDHMMKQRFLPVIRFVLGAFIGLAIMGVCAVILR